MLPFDPKKVKTPEQMAQPFRTLTDSITKPTMNANAITPAMVDPTKMVAPSVTENQVEPNGAPVTPQTMQAPSVQTPAAPTGTMAIHSQSQKPMALGAQTLKNIGENENAQASFGYGGLMSNILSQGGQTRGEAGFDAKTLGADQNFMDQANQVNMFAYQNTELNKRLKEAEGLKTAAEAKNKADAAKAENAAKEAQKQAEANAKRAAEQQAQTARLTQLQTPAAPAAQATPAAGGVVATPYAGIAQNLTGQARAATQTTTQMAPAQNTGITGGMTGLNNAVPTQPTAKPVSTGTMPANPDYMVPKTKDAGPDVMRPMVEPTREPIEEAPQFDFAALMNEITNFDAGVKQRQAANASQVKTMQTQVQQLGQQAQTAQATAQAANDFATFMANSFTQSRGGNVFNGDYSKLSNYLNDPENNKIYQAAMQGQSLDGLNKQAQERAAQAAASAQAAMASQKTQSDAMNKMMADAQAQDATDRLKAQELAKQQSAAAQERERLAAAAKEAAYNADMAHTAQANVNNIRNHANMSLQIADQGTQASNRMVALNDIANKPGAMPTGANIYKPLGGGTTYGAGDAALANPWGNANQSQAAKPASGSVTSRLQALTAEQRQQLMAKMTPDQRKQLEAAVKAEQGGAAKTGSTTSQFGALIGNILGKLG